MTSFAETFREARERVGLLQRDVADAANVSQSYVANIETGRTTPTKPETIRALAAAVGVDPDVLFAAAGRIPDDLYAAIVGDVEVIRTVRRAIMGGRREH